MENEPQFDQPIAQVPPSDGGWKRKRLLIVIAAVLVLAGAVIVLLVFILPERAAQPRRTAGEAAPQILMEDPAPDDHDRDGISNEEEAALGTSETEFDTDADGLADVDEIRVWKTDPKNPDSDGDGFGDGSEVVRGYNPTGPGRLQR